MAGEFLQYVDSDDILVARKFSRQVAALCIHTDAEVAQRPNGAIGSGAELTVPDISVVMGVRNGARDVERTLESVLCQEHVGLELVVVDDGSVDDTPRILAEFARRDSRVRLMRQDDRGLTHALIVGCEIAQGRFIARQDCGDLSHPLRLAKQSALLEAEPSVGFVSCWALVEGPEGEPLYEQHGGASSAAPEELLSDVGQRAGAPGPSHHGSVMFRRDLYRRCGGYRGAFRFGQDWDLWLRMAECSRFAMVPEQLYLARLGLDSISLSRKSEQSAFGRLAHEALALRLRGYPDDSVVARAQELSLQLQHSVAQRAPGEGSYFVGEALRRQGDGRARGYFVKAWRETPWNPKSLVRLAQTFSMRTSVPATLPTCATTVNPALARAPKRSDALGVAPMWILVVCDLPPDPNAGASGTIWQSVQALRRAGHEVETIWGDQLRRRVAHHGLHSVIELPDLYRRAVLDAVRRHRFDVVQVSQIHGYAAAAALRALDPRPIFVHRSHGLEARVTATVPPQVDALGADRRPSWRRAGTVALAKFAERHDRMAVRYADGHIVGCTACRDFLVGCLGAAPGAVAVIPQAAPEGYGGSAVSRMDSRRLRRVLSVAQYAFVKAPHRLLDVYGAIAARHPDIELTWVCAARHHLEIRQRSSPHLRERLELLDWRGQSELMQVYDRHGIFLFPSLFEGFGKAMVEAMMRGLCVVASDVSGARDVIDDGVNGFLCAPHDTATMVQRIEHLLNNGADAQRMSEAAAQRAASYTWDTVARASGEFFAKLRAEHCADASSAFALL